MYYLVKWLVVIKIQWILVRVELNYQKMVENREIVLWDSLDEGTEEQSSHRFTDYQAGDTISFREPSGNMRTYTICGIISKDNFWGYSPIGNSESQHPLALIYPQETALREHAEGVWSSVNGSEVEEEDALYFLTDLWRWHLMLTCDNVLPDMDVMRYCYKNRFFYNESVYDAAWNEVAGYVNQDLEMFRVVCAVAKIVGFSVAVIVLIQIILL